MELFKERARKIDVSAVGTGIPFIAPPFVLIIDRIGFIGGIEGDDLPAGFIAPALIEIPIVAVHQAALQAAIGAERWRRNRVCFVVDARRNFTVECEIVFDDLKNCAALSAFLLHRIYGTIGGDVLHIPHYSATGARRGVHGARTGSPRMCYVWRDD